MTKTLSAEPARAQSRANRLKPAQIARFLVIGGISTLAYLGLYAVLRIELSSQIANALALLITGDLNTVFNRCWTFGLTGSVPRSERVKGVAAYMVSLVATSGALAMLGLIGAEGRVAELTALLIANLAAGVVHFILLESWAFRRAAEQAA